MLTCSKCKVEKQESDFPKDKSSSTGYSSSCKLCNREYYHKNKEYLLAKMKARYNGRGGKERQREVYRERKQRCIDYKGGVCATCGEMPHPSAMDFHHVDPSTKSFSIGFGSKSFDKIKEELDKCVMLCANCHRQLHAEETDREC
jgi:hypothetical protein